MGFMNFGYNAPGTTKPVAPKPPVVSPITGAPSILGSSPVTLGTVAPTATQVQSNIDFTKQAEQNKATNPEAYAPRENLGNPVAAAKPAVNPNATLWSPTTTAAPLTDDQKAALGKSVADVMAPEAVTKARVEDALAGTSHTTTAGDLGNVVSYVAPTSALGGATSNALTAASSPAGSTLAAGTSGSGADKKDINALRKAVEDSFNNRDVENARLADADAQTALMQRRSNEMGALSGASTGGGMMNAGAAQAALGGAQMRNQIIADERGKQAQARMNYLNTLIQSAENALDRAHTASEREKASADLTELEAMRLRMTALINSGDTEV